MNKPGLRNLFKSCLIAIGGLMNRRGFYKRLAGCAT
jgi:hypothetical protein